MLEEDEECQISYQEGLSLSNKYGTMFKEVHNQEDVDKAFQYIIYDINYNVGEELTKAKQ